MFRLFDCLKSQIIPSDNVFRLSLKLRRVESNFSHLSVITLYLQWKNLYSRKPSENYEDPKMLAAIDDAKSNMGDFNLKTAKNYKVPESQRQGGTYKRAQLLELRRMVGKISYL